jgi:hypothetical protein
MAEWAAFCGGFARGDPEARIYEGEGQALGVERRGGSTVVDFTAAQRARRAQRA